MVFPIFECAFMLVSCFILVKICNHVPKFKNFIDRLIELQNQTKNIKSNAFLYYFSFIFSLLIVGCIVFRLAFTVPAESDLFIYRLYVTLLFFLISFLAFTLYITETKGCLPFLCAFIYLSILYYLKFIKQNIIWDTVFILLGTFATYYFTYLTLIAFKKLCPVIRRFLNTILSSEATGLKKVIETITSIFLSVSALLAGIYGLIAAFESLIKYFSN